VFKCYFDGIVLVQVGDIDGDGDMDILVGFATGASPVSWLENDGGRFITRKITLATPGVVGLQLIDMNVDGLPDVVATMAGGNLVWFKSGFGARTWAANEVNIPGDSVAAAVFDYDQDGDNGTPSDY